MTYSGCQVLVSERVHREVLESVPQWATVSEARAFEITISNVQMTAYELRAAEPSAAMV